MQKREVKLHIFPIVKRDARFLQWNFCVPARFLRWIGLVERLNATERVVK